MYARPRLNSLLAAAAASLAVSSAARLARVVRVVPSRLADCCEEVDKNGQSLYVRITFCEIYNRANGGRRRRTGDEERKAEDGRRREGRGEDGDGTERRTDGGADVRFRDGTEAGKWGVTVTKKKSQPRRSARIEK